jgi:hypothetical protein
MYCKKEKNNNEKIVWVTNWTLKPHINILIQGHISVVEGTHTYESR